MGFGGWGWGVGGWGLKGCGIITHDSKSGARLFVDVDEVDTGSTGRWLKGAQGFVLRV